MNALWLKGFGTPSAFRLITQNQSEMTALTDANKFFECPQAKVVTKSAFITLLASTMHTYRFPQLS